jgi:predicted lipid-binding transport protein (Tim44 family)
MKLFRIAGVFLPALLGTTLPHAQTAAAAGESVSVPTAMLEQQAGSWKSLLDNPVLGIVVVLAVVAVAAIAIAAALRRRTDQGYSYEDNGPVTYMGGYERVEPRANATYRGKVQKADNDEKTDSVVSPWNVPADFDVPRFLRKCKAYFMRLQTSWDGADVKDIRRFTTRELFGEFCKQLNERGKGASVTEVVTLGAELQGVETVGGYYIATVKFTGMVKEDQEEVVPFSEIWSLSKPLDGHRSWVLAKIQQPI